MHRFILTLAVALVIVVAGADCPLSAADQANELVGRLPAGANSVAIVRVAEILQTGRALRENWAARQAEEFLSGAAVVHPAVQLLVVGSLVHPSVPEEVWSAGMAILPPATSFQAVAKAEGGTIDTLAGRAAVRGQRNALFIELSPGWIGVYAPAFRQDAARWVQSIATPRADAVSPFLRQAATLTGHIVLAIDLADMLDVERASQRLMMEKTLVMPGGGREALVRQLVGVQGATLAVTVGEGNQSELALTFAAPVGDSAKVLQQVFSTVLGDLGVGIEEFDDASAVADGNRLVIKTDLSDASLRRILSLVVTPSARMVEGDLANAAPPANPAPAPAPAVKAGVVPPARPVKNPNVVYYNAVSSIIDDLKVATRKAKDYERTATWHENFARKIENLPVAGVDPDLLAFGRSTADKFRALAASLRGQKVTLNAQANTFTYNVNYDPGWAAINVWGGAGYRDPTWNVQTNAQEIREKQAAAVTAGSDQRIQIWQAIDNERGAMAQEVKRKWGDGGVK